MRSDYQVLHFSLQQKGFALPLSGIVEIIYFKPPMEVPQLRAPFKGVIELRDKVIPVIDLYQILEMDGKDSGQADYILIIQYKKTLMGLLVDDVREVLYFSADQLRAASFQDKEKNKYLIGIFKYKEELILLLDIEKILDLEAYQMLNQFV